MHSGFGDNTVRPHEKPRDTQECSRSRPRHPCEDHLVLLTLYAVHLSQAGLHAATILCPRPREQRVFPEEAKDLLIYLWCRQK